MGFMESYKHLDKLCGEILGDNRKLSAYIDEMINLPRGPYLVAGWDDDIKQLKYYRWVRNQIAHDPNCDESNMCNPDDVEWLEDFYLRIMDQTDPLALYAQAVKTRPMKNEKQAVENDFEGSDDTSQNHAGAGAFKITAYLLLFLFSLALLLIALIGSRGA